MSLKLDFVELPARLPADAELALYRILQEALNNVEKHARSTPCQGPPEVAERIRSFADC